MNDQAPPPIMWALVALFSPFDSTEEHIPIDAKTSSTAKYNPHFILQTFSCYNIQVLQISNNSSFYLTKEKKKRAKV